MPFKVTTRNHYAKGFHTRKAGYLRAAAKICVDKYEGDIPPDLKGLMALPGVGPKMSYLVMNVG